MKQRTRIVYEMNAKKSVQMLELGHKSASKPVVHTFLCCVIYIFEDLKKIWNISSEKYPRISGHAHEVLLAVSVASQTTPKSKVKICPTAFSRSMTLSWERWYLSIVFSE